MSPETPIWDIVDRCRVWESHADSDARRFSKPGPESALPVYTVDKPGYGRDDRMVAAVTTSPTPPDQLECLLRRLLLALVVPTPPTKQVPSALEQLLQRLLVGLRHRSLFHRRRLGLLTLRLCYKIYFPGYRPQLRGRSRVPYEGTGLRWCISHVAKRVMARPGVLI